MKVSLGAHTLGMPAPVWVVGSYGADGRPNIMTASWGGICSSAPPCLAVSIQKRRLSHANIMACRAFTINVPSLAHLAEADYAGTVSGRDLDKFAATGLTAEPSAKVKAPLVREFPLALECTVVKTVDLGSHTHFIGEIVDVKAEEWVLDSTGALVTGKVAPLVATPAERAYYALGAYLAQAHTPGLALLDQGVRGQYGHRHRPGVYRY